MPRYFNVKWTKKGHNVLVWGASEHARVVSEAIRGAGVHKIVGYVSDVAGRQERKEWDGLPVYKSCGHLAAFVGEKIKNIVPGFGDCDGRLNLIVRVKEMGFELMSVVHPKAYVAVDVEVGGGTIILAGAIVATGAQIGEAVIVNTGATVDHGCVLGDAVHLSPGVHLGGCVNIGKATWLGIGSVVSDHVQIGENTVIGAGSVVLQNIPSNVVAYGIPAKVVREKVEHAAGRR